MPTITPKITPFLWFESQAEQAAKFYTSVFPNSRILAITHYAEGMPLPKGTVLTVSFEIAGQRVTALNGGPHFKLTEAFSFAVSCDSQAEIDKYWDTLISGGGEPSQCGWLKDRFGLSWQIVPANLTDMITGPHAARVMQAIMPMRKLDLAKLNAAAAGR